MRTGTASRCTHYALGATLEPPVSLPGGACSIAAAGSSAGGGWAERAALLRLEPLERGEEGSDGHSPPRAGGLGAAKGRKHAPRERARERDVAQQADDVPELEGRHGGRAQRRGQQRRRAARKRRDAGDARREVGERRLGRLLVVVAGDGARLVVVAAARRGGRREEGAGGAAEAATAGAATAEE